MGLTIVMMNKIVKLGVVWTCFYAIGKKETSSVKDGRDGKALSGLWTRRDAEENKGKQSEELRRKIGQLGSSQVSGNQSLWPIKTHPRCRYNA